jgi:ech hydrogenase subunit D
MMDTMEIKPQEIIDIPNIRDVDVSELLERVKKAADGKRRFVTMTALDRGDHFEVLYHFDRDLHLEHLRVRVPKGRTLPSISSVYLAAFLVENEIKELFGLDITDIAIDYQNHLYLIEGAEPAPMAKDKPLE